MVWLVRLLIWGPSGSPAVKPQMGDNPIGDRPPFQEFTFGNIRGRAWRNWSPRGEVYFSIDVVRLLAKGRIAKSFRPEDIGDAIRVLTRLQAWHRDGT